MGDEIGNEIVYEPGFGNVFAFPYINPETKELLTAKELKSSEKYEINEYNKMPLKNPDGSPSLKGDHDYTYIPKSERLSAKRTGNLLINNYKPPPKQDWAVVASAPTGHIDSAIKKGQFQLKKKPKRMNMIPVYVTDKPLTSFYAINDPDSPLFVYALLKTLTIKELIKRKFEIWRRNEHDFPDIDDDNYIKPYQYDNPLSPENNICFFLLISVWRHGKKNNIVSEIFGFGNNDRFQQDIDNLLTEFSDRTGFFRENIQCCAINLNTYNYHDDVTTHQRAQQVHTYAVYFYSTKYNNQIPTKDGGWQSTVQPIDFLNTKVNVMDGFSENSKIENRIINGPLEKLFAEILGFTIKERNEETAGGTRKKKRKTKRKIQRSKRRSQKNSNRSLKHRQ